MRRIALVLVFAASAVAQTPVQPTPPPKAVPTTTFPPALYARDDVRKSMNLTADQITTLNKVTEANNAKMLGDYQKLLSLPEADRFNRMQELNRQYTADWNKAASDTFNADQRARYQQLQYQYGGFNSFYDPDVQKRLNLTADQVKDLRAQWDWADRGYQDAYKLNSTDAAKAATAYRDYRTAYQERINKYLTADQQKAWKEMTGDPYAFEPYFPNNR